MTRSDIAAVFALVFVSAALYAASRDYSFLAVALGFAAGAYAGNVRGPGEP